MALARYLLVLGVDNLDNLCFFGCRKKKRLREKRPKSDLKFVQTPFVSIEASNWAVFDGWFAGQPVLLGAQVREGCER